MPASRAAVMAVVCLAVCAACGGGSSSGTSPTTPTPTPTIPVTPVTDVATAFQTLATKAIYFGHQSVGFNIMEGVQTLLTSVGATAPRIQSTSSPNAMSAGVFAHASNGSNGDPMGKTAAFSGTIQGGVGSRVHIAFFKFCYVDFSSSTDVAAVFADYQSRMTALEAAYPNVRFVHVTAPLQTGSNSANVVRERYNELVRHAYSATSPLFDLAKVEATKADGSEETYNGVRALVAAYSSDGGHLNATGEEVVAKALILYLATL
jgi:hypothetical protein